MNFRQEPCPSETGSAMCSPQTNMSWTVPLAGCLLLVALLIHFGTTALFVGPTNPIKLEYGELMNGYMLPQFDQTWTLFAPEPIADERGLLVRAKLRSGDREPELTQFIDITSPPIFELHSNRLFPSRKTRVVSTALQMLLWEDPLLEEYRNTVQDREGEQQDRDNRGGGAEERDGVETGNLPVLVSTPEEQSYRKRTTAYIQRLATLAATERWGSRVSEVQVRLVQHVFPRFSERHDRSTGEIVSHDLEWMAIGAEQS